MRSVERAFKRDGRLWLFKTGVYWMSVSRCRLIWGRFIWTRGWQTEKWLPMYMYIQYFVMGGSIESFSSTEVTLTPLTPHTVSCCTWLHSRHVSNVAMLPTGFTCLVQLHPQCTVRRPCMGDYLRWALLTKTELLPWARRAFNQVNTVFTS